MSYGHFSDDAPEYVITRPDTPTPWVNYLTNGRYCAICSQTGGGHSFFETVGLQSDHTGESHKSRCCRDGPGRYVYLRDAETGRVLERQLAARVRAL